MTKWDYIRLISANGDRYGYNNGIYDFLEWCGKHGTRDVTCAEARCYYKMKEINYMQKKMGFSENRKAHKDHEIIYLGGR